MLAPGDEYEKQRAEVVKQLSAIAPEPVLLRLSQLIRLAITLTSSPPTNALPPLTSKLGGSPDAPIGFEWPLCEGQPLSFIAQLNLEELAPFDLEERLPPSGLLSFWANDVLAIDFLDEPQLFGAWRVFHFQGKDCHQLSSTEVAHHTDCQIFPSAPTQSHILASLADVWGNTEFAGENFERPVAEALHDLCSRSHHQMFGFPDSIQDDPRNEASVSWNQFLDSPQARELELSPEHDETKWQDWELLLQISGDDNADMEWGDSGAIYFLIRKRDLEAKKFDRCCFVFQCC